MQTRFRFPLHCQPSLKKQRVRILAAARQCQEVVPRPAQGHVRFHRTALQAAVHNLERQRQGHIDHAQADTFPGQFTESLAKRLTAQCLIEDRRHEVLVCGRRNEAQQSMQRGWNGRHARLLQGFVMHSCHAGTRGNLMCIKRGAP